MAEETLIANDTVAKTEVAGGFVFVYLRDTDDGDTYQLGEDEIVQLHKYLESVIKQHKLA